MQEIGRRLQRRARELGFSDAEVARRVGLSQNRYANYVGGVREPDLRTFGRICEVLRTTPGEMMGLEQNAARKAQTPLRDRIDSLLDGMDPHQLELTSKLIAVVASEPARDVAASGRSLPAGPAAKPSARSRSRRSPASTAKQDPAR